MTSSHGAGELLSADWVELAVEAWRIQQWAASYEGSPVVRIPARAARVVEELIRRHGVSFHDQRGQPYHDGLAVEVVDRQSGDGPAIVVETIRPLVVRDGVVLVPAQVVVGPSPADETGGE